jgi:hypothetical protein
MDPDPTPFFSDFKDKKVINFRSYIFLITYPQAHHLQSYKINFLLKFLFNFYFASIISLFQSAEHLYEKREGSGSAAGSILTHESGSERPKNGSPTLRKSRQVALPTSDLVILLM